MEKFLLLIPILLPLLGGATVNIVKFENRNTRQAFVMGVVLATTATTWILLGVLQDGQYVLFEMAENLVISFLLDTPARIFAVMVSALWPIATLYSFQYMTHESRENTFFTFYTMTFGVTLGIAFSGSLLTLYIFYEMITLITVPLVMHSMTRAAVHVARKYMYYSLGGAAVAFIGLVFVVVYGSTTEFVPGGAFTPYQIAEYGSLLLGVFVMTFLGFGVKAALVPGHDWLPSASIAPMPVTALLHAVAVVKSGIFALLRLTYYVFGVDFLEGTWAQYAVMSIAIISMLYGSIMAVKEQHVKKRLAYSTIGNLSYIVFAITIMNPIGLVAALLHMVAHGVMKICGFFSVGNITYMTHRQYLKQMDGLGRAMPVTFICLTISSLSLIGIPLFVGFVSKWNIAQAVVASDNPLAGAGLMALIICSFLTAIYMMTIVIRGFMSVKGSIADAKDPNWYMKAPIILFALLVILLGVYPQPLMSAVEGLLLSMGV